MAAREIPSPGMVSDHHNCPFDLLTSTGMKIKTVAFVVGERVPICLDATARLSLVAILGMDIPANCAIPQAPKTPGHESQHTCLQTASMLIRQTTISMCTCWHNRSIDRTYAQCAPGHSHTSCTWCCIREVTRNTSHTHVFVVGVLVDDMHLRATNGSSGVMITTPRSSTCRLRNSQMQCRDAWASAFNRCDASERSTVHFSNQMNGSDVTWGDV